MQMQERLLKIRKKRYENAEADVRRCRLLLERARQQLDAAEAAVLAFDADRRAKIQNIYNALIGKEILRSRLDDARIKERILNEKLEAMKAEAKNCAHQVEEKKDLLSQAHQHLMASQKGKVKAEEIYEEAVNEKQRAEILREDEVIDEFAERMGH